MAERSPLPLAAVGPEAAALLAAIHATAFDRPWDLSAFADLLTGAGVIALAAGDDGFILVRRVLDEAEVLTLAVRPSARRRGLARTLVEAAASALQAVGAATLWLEVAEDNAAALALYAAAGFVRSGSRPGYYARMEGPSVAAVVMKRSLG